MPSIYYEKTDGDVYQINEVSQRLLVYVHLHGRARLEDVVDTIGADNEHTLQSRILSQLGEDAARLVETEQSIQKTFGNNSNTVISPFVLTTTGEEFVEKHRADLSMPADIAKLAQRVSALQIEDGLLDDLRYRVNELEDRVAELE